MQFITTNIFRVWISKVDGIRISDLMSHRLPLRNCGHIAAKLPFAAIPSIWEIEGIYNHRKIDLW